MNWWRVLLYPAHAHRMINRCEQSGLQHWSSRREHKAEIMHTQILGCRGAPTEEASGKGGAEEALDSSLWMHFIGTGSVLQFCSSDGESAIIFVVVEQSKGVMQENRTVSHLEYAWMIGWLPSQMEINILTNCITVVTAMCQAHFGKGTDGLSDFAVWWTTSRFLVTEGFNEMTTDHTLHGCFTTGAELEWDGMNTQLNF